MTSAAMVVKVGGSLYDLPDLGGRLRRWLEQPPTRQVLLFPGGAAAADAVRGLDRCHGLGEEHAHWLALRALTVNAHFLAALLPGAAVVSDLSVCAGLWQRGLVAVADPYPLALADEGQPGQLPHTWEVTSDTLAGRVALLLGAGELVLLKSVACPAETDWTEAARCGIVDRFFPRLLAANPAALRVRVVNFRS
jgi:aspartokinase-like uncharacterized kinase